MTRRLWLRIGLVAVVAAISIFYLYPPRKTINLGLDLQGGIHLVLGVDIDQALQIQTDRTAERVRSAIEAKGIAVQKAERRGNSEIQIQLASPSGFAEAQTLLQKDFPSFEVKEPDQSGGRLVLAMRPQ
jgi:preprotein translocase subunit SecD